MRRFPLLLMTLALLGLLYLGCDAAGDSGTVTLEGQVLDESTNDPIPGASVRVVANPSFRDLEDVVAIADERGNFSVKVKLEESVDIQIIAKANGYGQDLITVFGIAGETVEVPKFRLQRTRAEDPNSGNPSNIILVGQTLSVIGIKESGSPEVTRITFQVADSAGRPVTLDKETLVRFSFGQRPGGDEFIAPAQAPTDNNGLVTVNLSSGTKAGTVQIIATAQIGGQTIRSKPVPIAIHGGLPDNAHFSVGPGTFNFPGLLKYGLTNSVSVIVGDKYSNPVKPNTAVYFKTDYGVIEGSSFTNATGQGTVNLISANPLPPDGIAKITASTADENDVLISKDIPVLFSGYPKVTITPATAILNRTYTLTVTDQNNNPLVAGTQINVRAEGTKVKAVGSTEVILAETVFTGLRSILKGPGITQFTFRVVEDLNIEEGGVPTLESITITLRSPNGNLSLTLTPGGATAGKGEIVSKNADGTLVVEAKPLE